MDRVNNKEIVVSKLRPRSAIRDEYFIIEQSLAGISDVIHACRILSLLGNTHDVPQSHT